MDEYEQIGCVKENAQISKYCKLFCMISTLKILLIYVKNVQSRDSRK